MAQTVKRLPTMGETWIQSLGWEDLLEKEMVTHSSILAWRISWREEPGRLQSMGLQSLYSYLENPMDREPGGLQSTGSQRDRHD